MKAMLLMLLVLYVVVALAHCEAYAHKDAFEFKQGRQMKSLSSAYAHNDALKSVSDKATIASQPQQDKYKFNSDPKHMNEDTYAHKDAFEFQKDPMNNGRQMNTLLNKATIASQPQKGQDKFNNVPKHGHPRYAHKDAFEPNNVPINQGHQIDGVSNKEVASLQQGSNFEVDVTLYFEYTSDDPGSEYEAYGNVQITLGTETFTIWDIKAPENGGNPVDVSLGNGKTISETYSVNSITPIRVEGYIDEEDDIFSGQDDEIVRPFDDTVADNLDEVFGMEHTYRFDGHDGFAEITIEVIQGARLVIDLHIGYSGNDNYYQPHGTVTIHQNNNKHTVWDLSNGAISCPKNVDYIRQYTYYEVIINPTTPTATLRVTGLVFESDEYNIMAVINSPQFTINRSNYYSKTFTGGYGFATIGIRVDTI